MGEQGTWRLWSRHKMAFRGEEGRREWLRGRRDQSRCRTRGWPGSSRGRTWEASRDTYQAAVRPEAPKSVFEVESVQEEPAEDRLPCPAPFHTLPGGLGAGIRCSRQIHSRLFSKSLQSFSTFDSSAFSGLSCPQVPEQVLALAGRRPVPMQVVSWHEVAPGFGDPSHSKGLAGLRAFGFPACAWHELSRV